MQRFNRFMDHLMMSSDSRATSDDIDIKLDKIIVGGQTVVPVKDDDQVNKSNHHSVQNNRSDPIIHEDLNSNETLFVKPKNH